MKVLVGAFNQEKALVGAFSVIVQPVVEPMDRFTALNITLPRSRPTALLPFWHVAGYALGAGTALLGKEAAMACTVAVEVGLPTLISLSFP